VRASWATFFSLGRMAAHLSIRQVEDQPALANICAGQAEFVSQESPQLLSFGGVKHRMNAFDHFNARMCDRIKV
jgi:hypothetical protein